MRLKFIFERSKILQVFKGTLLVGVLDVLWMKEVLLVHLVVTLINCAVLTRYIIQLSRRPNAKPFRAGDSVIFNPYL